ncbi:Lsr2 family protein [Microbacterium pseudoresistens]|uniref:Lsr2 family protein n=1 Tax=Microbacterium pseudoresistens TaxID=640634 RepID=A0A7Y9EUL1_9MICO|nr:Lsr2 family protein [Microbacterium pseudoresistens]NYD53360.1 hypothetical protein [Microbacterium pseudoresistens]
MARKIIHQLVDDIDGTVLDSGDGETVHFSLDGNAYEIDLTHARAEELRAALAPFIEAGRRASRAGRPAPRAVRTRGRNPEVAAIRAWAASNGYSVSERGRIPAEITEAYNAAH